jgi:hypothetical protein
MQLSRGWACDGGHRFGARSQGTGELLEFSSPCRRRCTGRRAQGRLETQTAVKRKSSRARFDVSGRAKPDPKRAYLATIIFCMEPGHCDQFAPFPKTKVVVVKAVTSPNIAKSTEWISACVPVQAELIGRARFGCSRSEAAVCDLSGVADRMRDSTRPSWLPNEKTI